MAEISHLHLRELVETWRDNSKSKIVRDACFYEVYSYLLKKAEGRVRSFCSSGFSYLFFSKNSNMNLWISEYQVILFKCFQEWDFDSFTEQEALSYFWRQFDRRIIDIIKKERRIVDHTEPPRPDGEDGEDGENTIENRAAPHEDPMLDMEQLEICNLLASVVLSFRGVSLVKDARAEKKMSLSPNQDGEEMQHNFIMRDGKVIYHTQRVNTGNRKAAANYFPCFFASDLTAVAESNSRIQREVYTHYTQRYQPSIDENLLRYVVSDVNPKTNYKDNAILYAVFNELKPDCSFPLSALVTYEYTESTSCPFYENRLKKTAYYQKRNLYADLLDALLQQNEGSAYLNELKKRYERIPEGKEESTP